MGLFGGAPVRRTGALVNGTRFPGEVPRSDKYHKPRWAKERGLRESARIMTIPAYQLDAALL